MKTTIPEEALEDAQVYSEFSMLKAVNVSLGRRKSNLKLNQQHKEVRIVELYPRTFRTRVGRKHPSCYTKTVSLDGEGPSNVSYVAISYATATSNSANGSSHNTAAATGMVYVNNRLMSVPAELADALEHFEHERLALRMWADEVCINMADDADRAHGMTMTKEIFRKAERVLVWLGRTATGSDSAMRALLEIGNEAVQARAEAWARADYDEHQWTYNMQEKQAELRRKWFPAGIDGFYGKITQNVLHRPWFRRVASLQEAALNEKVFFVSGGKSIPKFVLWDAVNTIMQVSSSIKVENRMSMQDVSQALLPEILPDIDVVSHRTLDFVIHPTCTTMEQLLLFTSSDVGQSCFEVRDPRDRVFALLSLAPDDKLGIEADYSKSARDLYCETTEIILKRSTSLSLLCASVGRKNIAGLPSWVPDWTVPIPSILGNRAHGIFSASGVDARPRIMFGSSTEGQALLVAAGYRFDTVTGVLVSQWNAGWPVDFSEESPLMEFLCDINEFATEHVTAYDTGPERFDALWRTLIADSDAHFLELGNVDEQVLVPRSRASLRMKHAFEALTAGVAKNPTDAAWRVAACKPYVQMLRNEALGRRIFVTSGGFIGLGHEDVAPGDLVTILRGGDSPFVLRPRYPASGTDTSQMEGSAFQIIGEAYVHGIMDGEFLHTLPGEEVFAMA